ncbi:fimbrillin family protein [uncultured Sphingobacterium sp.]|uniref:fimbrillin family protein n=1 Tax=uncultured Sphingobacterium sp. TaxID=182688 RepID=UPI0025F3A266|nr:fimbrillin family protein [uncultured Sphingobacterium sp.]
MITIFKQQSIKAYIMLCFFLIPLLTTPIFQSCKRVQELTEEGNGTISTVEINLAGAEYGEDENPDIVTKASNKNGVAVLNKTGIQEFVIPFDDNLAIFGSLETVNSNTPSNVLQASSGKKAATETNPLAQGVKYTVIVYNADGTYNTSKTFTYGSTETGFTLDGGKTYTFVAVSLNSSTAPTIPNLTTNTLANATVSNATNYLMYFKQQLTLSQTLTRLNVILKHQFSQITTKISTNVNSTSNTKYINSISNVFIGPHYPSASIKLADGSITYTTPVTSTGASVTFPSIGSNITSLTSAPTPIIYPTTTTGTLAIGALSIDGQSKSNLTQSNLAITPGHRYNLNLNFAVPCTENVSINGGFNFTYNGLTDGTRTPAKTITAPNADYGFVLNIYYLDNSFNMKINNVALATNEIQFEPGLSGYPLNIEFADGTQYGTTADTQIYNINNGTDTAPSIRVVISPTGAISMFGRKRNSDLTLYPLRLKSGTSFNTVTWNTTSTNTITVDQLVAGTTSIRGNGIGKKIIQCQ